MAADWDKAAEQIGEIAEHFRQIFAKIDRIEASQQRCIEIADRMLERPLPRVVEPDPLSGYVADALKEAHEQRVTRGTVDHVVQDMHRIRKDTGFWSNEVHKLLGRFSELQAEVRELKKRLDALEGRQGAAR